MACCSPSRPTSWWRSGLNIVVGYAGLLDLGYVGFYAVGAYTVGVLSSEHGHLPWLVTVPVAVVVAMVSGIILGAPDPARPR